MANGDIEVTSTAKSPTAVSTATSVVTSAAGIGAAAGALSSVSNISFGASGVKLPLANPLHKYSSVTHIFTLAALDPKSLGSPETTYMKGDKLPIVFKTAGGSPNNRIKTKYGQFDFYVDELVINSNYGFMQGTGNTNATNISMTISEPLSMGMFPIALNQAAYNAGKYPDFRSCVFLLKIEFKGEDQNGNMVSAKDTTRYIPLNFRSLNMSVNEGGSVYKCEAIPAADMVMLSSNSTIPIETTISGSTVSEILQTGPNSLQAVLNRQLQEVAKKSKAPIPDEIVILFPGSSSTKMTGAKPGEDEKQSGGKATEPVVKPKDDETIIKELNVKRSSINNTLIQTEINEIGATDLGYSETRRPKTSAVDPSKAYSEQGYLQPSPNLNPKISEYVFKQASSIQNAINQVILSSDYGVNVLKEEPKDGWRTWWRIETSIYHIDSTANFPATGRYPQVLVYKVVPYKVHATNMPVPGVKSSKFKSLIDQCVKIYNYIYTGKNTDILRFNLDFDNRFVTALSADQFKNNKDIALSAQEGKTKENPQVVDANFQGKPKEQSEGYNALVNNKATQFNSDKKGRGGEETSAHRAARAFHDAITFGIDLQNIELEIIGDPYWLTGNGMGNFTYPPTKFMNLSSDGSVNYQNGEVDMAINFRTPIDLNPTTGLYTMAGKRSAQFSGVYRVQKVQHSFKDGQFTQTIKANRRQISPSDMEDVNFNVKKAETPPKEGSIAGGDGTWSI